ncbi:MAG: FliH/SctL family protein [Planctomycetota bacterium]|jgi:flagellar biosynthesis/type III secretory pathway protein FliH
MALIKGSKAGDTSRHSFLDLHDLKEQAERVLDEARAEAKRIVVQARADAATQIEQARERARADGHDRGFAEGRQAGEAEGRAEALETYSARLETLVAGWSEVLADLQASRNAMLAAAREDVLTLALAMGEKVCHRVIETDGSAVVDQVAEALHLVASPSAVTVWVNPQDRPFVENVLADLVDRIGQCTHAELRDEPSVGRGGCIVTTDRGRIDATIDRQLERICEVLLGRATLRSPEDTRGESSS